MRSNPSVPLVSTLITLLLPFGAHADSAACFTLFAKKDGPYTKTVDEFTGVTTIESRCIPVEENGWGALRFYHFSRPKKLILNIEVEAAGGFKRDSTVHFLVNGKRIAKRAVGFQAEVKDYAAQLFRVVVDVEVSEAFITQLSKAESVKIQVGGVAVTPKSQLASAASDFLSAFDRGSKR